MRKKLSSPIKIAVSSCLLGEAVRYDGVTKQNSIITNQLAKQFNLISLCPEMAIGLGVPRDPIKIIVSTETQGGLALVDEKKLSLNYTNKMLSYAKQQHTHLKTMCGYIVKERSPSCGLHKTPRFSFDGEISSYGAGLFTHYIKANIPWLPIISEFDLENVIRLDNFLERVYILQLWNNSQKSDTGFNESIEHQIELRGKNLNNKNDNDINEIMTILTIPITMDMQVKFLESQFKKYSMISDDITAAISNYKNGKLSLYNIIDKFQLFFEQKNMSMQSNYFYPNEHEVKNRDHYFG